MQHFIVTVRLIIKLDLWILKKKNIDFKYSWAKLHVKVTLGNTSKQSTLFHLVLSASGGRGKSHLPKLFFKQLVRYLYIEVFNQKNLKSYYLNQQVFLQLMSMVIQHIKVCKYPVELSFFRWMMKIKQNKEMSTQKLSTSLLMNIDGF